jgi:hypothetical protein
MAGSIRYREYGGSNGAVVEGGALREPFWSRHEEDHKATQDDPGQKREAKMKAKHRRQRARAAGKAAGAIDFAAAL